MCKSDPLNPDIHSFILELLLSLLQWLLPYPNLFDCFSWLLYEFSVLLCRTKTMWSHFNAGRVKWITAKKRLPCICIPGLKWRSIWAISMFSTFYLFNYLKYEWRFTQPRTSNLHHSRGEVICLAAYDVQSIYRNKRQMHIFILWFLSAFCPRTTDCFYSEVCWWKMKDP